MIACIATFRDDLGKMLAYHGAPVRLGVGELERRGTWQCGGRAAGEGARRRGGGSRSAQHENRARRRPYDQWLTEQRRRRDRGFASLRSRTAAHSGDAYPPRPPAGRLLLPLAS